ncbi:MAG: hypothetical protein AAFR11_12640 [Pseudomonadota bacterium]
MMRNPARAARAFFLGSLVCLAVASCAKVSIFGEADPSPDLRTGLIAAKDRLSDTPWPDTKEPNAVDWAAMIFFGAKMDIEKNRAEAIDVYIAEAVDPNDPVAAVEQDVLQMADAAYAVADAAFNLVAVEPRITIEDLDLVQQAIGAVRVHRDMFGSAYRALEQKGYGDARAARFRSDDILTEAVKRLGEAADAMSAVSREEGRAAGREYQTASRG